MKRTFIAIKIPLSYKTKELLNNVKVELKDEKIRWVENHNMHITLFFLGDTDETKIVNIGNDLKNALHEFEAFHIQCKGIGVFKSIFRPRAFWIGIEKSKNLENLNSIIRDLMISFGFTSDYKEFRPHLTIGRLKHIKDIDKLKSLIDLYKEFEIQNVKVTEICFFESQLTPQGSIYKSLETICLD
jgi:2'-5' RNA ligase